MGAVGMLGLVLSAVGISGVMAFSVAQRTHETGIRMALGASPMNVLRMFIWNALKLLALGLVIGLPISFALARLLLDCSMEFTPTMRPRSWEERRCLARR